MGLSGQKPRIGFCLFLGWFMFECPRYCEIFGPGACVGVFDEKECVMNAPQTAMETLRLELPIPPLVNHYWRHITIKGTPRTLISARGRDFRENVVRIVGREKKALKIDSRVKINVRVYPPDRRKRDIDGYLKALLDSLTHAGVWLDDEQVDSIYITRGEVVKGGKAVVEILPMGE